mmetsp:Transcript_40133/g.76716  ORF Transcript_40133/g.76716 Transcript_40133/m.76716 type:complete len:81 (-) Transcript_40133:110-352(-)
MSNDSFVHHFLDEPQALLDNLLEDNHAKLKAHAAWYNDEDQEIDSVGNVTTTNVPLDMWIAYEGLFADILMCGECMDYYR